MPKSRQWTEIDFATPEHVVPDYKEHRKKLDEGERHDWYLSEIRQRRAAKVTENEVIGWLNSEGLDSTTITWLLVTAATDDVASTNPSLHFNLAVAAEDHLHPLPSPYRQGVTTVHTDPVASTRARSDASRITNGGEVHDTPAPEFRFAKPADADEAWRSQHAYDMGTVVKGMILVIIILIVIVLGVFVAAFA